MVSQLRLAPPCIIFLTLYNTVLMCIISFLESKLVGMFLNSHCVFATIWTMWCLQFFSLRVFYSNDSSGCYFAINFKVQFLLVTLYVLVIIIIVCTTCIKD